MGRPPHETWSDETLVAVVQADPESEDGRRAAHALLMRWRERLYLWCFGMVRERELALDLTQECLVRAYRALPTFESRAAVSSWLFAIARNRCRSAMRARPLRRDPDVDMEELEGRLAGPGERYEGQEEFRRVMEAMDSALAPLERHALWLRAFESMGVDDITRVLGIEGAAGARSVLQNARRKLRAALGPRGLEVGT